MPQGVKRASRFLLQLPVLPADFQAIQSRLLLIFYLCYFDHGINFQSFTALFRFLLLLHLEYFKGFCHCHDGLSDYSLHDSALKPWYNSHTACTTHKAMGLPSACSSWALSWVHWSYWEDSTGWFEPGLKWKLQMCEQKWGGHINEEGCEDSSSGRNEPVIPICHTRDGSWYHKKFIGFRPGSPEAEQKTLELPNHLPSHWRSVFFYSGLPQFEQGAGRVGLSLQQTVVSPRLAPV